MARRYRRFNRFRPRRRFRRYGRRRMRRLGGIGRSRYRSSIAWPTETKFINHYAYTNAVPITGFINTYQAKLSGGLNVGTPSESVFTGITQGVTRQTRVGNVIWVTGVKFTIGLLMSNPLDSGVQVASDTIRFILYWDKQTNGGAATVADILDDGNVSETNGASIRSSYAMQTIVGFKILKDFKVKCNIDGPTKVVVTDIDGNTAAQPKYGPQFASKIIKISLRFRKPMRVVYTGPNGTLGELFQNNIGLLSITDYSRIATYTNIRTYFKDD